MVSDELGLAIILAISASGRYQTYHFEAVDDVTGGELPWRRGSWGELP